MISGGTAKCQRRVAATAPDPLFAKELLFHLNRIVRTPIRFLFPVVTFPRAFADPYCGAARRLFPCTCGAVARADGARRQSNPLNSPIRVVPQNHACVPPTP